MSNGVLLDERSTHKNEINIYRTTMKELYLWYMVWQIKNKTKYPNSGSGVLQTICKITNHVKR
jgi:hypothetical protein